LVDLIGMEDASSPTTQATVLLTKAGVTGTPVFYINGRMLSGAQRVKAFGNLLHLMVTRLTAGSTIHSICK